MSQTECGSIREWIPDVVARRASGMEAEAVDAHVLACDECRAELELVRALREARPQAPKALADRVVSAVKRDRRALRRPWWGISAAAVAALALGIGVTSQSGGPTPVSVPDYAYEMEEGALWSSDDGLLAGAPTLDELSDEALMELLDELALDLGGAA